MIDIRYHVTSIMAIFLALAIGIIIGSSLAPGETNKLTSAVKAQSLKVDLIYNHDQDLISKDEDSLMQLAPQFVQNKLQDRSIAIIQTGNEGDAANKEAQTAVELAGGTVVSTTVITSQFDKLTADDLSQYRQLMPEIASTSDPLADTLSPLVLALSQGTDKSSFLDGYISILIKHGLIKTSGDYTRPVSLVIIVGGIAQPSTEDSKILATRETTLVQQLLQRPNLKVVGCECLTTTTSSIPVYHATGIASVDCIDNPVGKIDMVYALTGEKASFGYSPTADRMLPADIDQRSSSNSSTRSGANQ
jgi:hypothetical protein